MHKSARTAGLIAAGILAVGIAGTPVDAHADDTTPVSTCESENAMLVARLNNLALRFESQMVQIGTLEETVHDLEVRVSRKQSTIIRLRAKVAGLRAK